MLAAIAIPEQLATAKLAGFPPAAGLVAFVCAGIVFAILGRNRFLSVGADSTIAPIFAGGIAAMAAGSAGDYAAIAGLVAIVSGALLIAAGLSRSGWIANLLSQPVTIGFLAGIAVHIVVGQLPSLLGIPGAKGRLLDQSIAIVHGLPHANGASIAVGLAVLAVTLATARINDRIPGALLAIVGSGCAYALLGLHARGVAAVGALDAHFPALRVPWAPDLAHLANVVPLSIVVAAVCVMQTSAVVRAFPSQEGVAEDVSNDFTAVGAGSVLAALFGAFAVDASPPRTAVVSESGGHTQAATLLAVAAIAILAAFFSGFAADLPEAALAGVLIFIALRIFRIREMTRVARFSQREFMLLVASALLVVALPIEDGMLLAIILSLAHGIFLVMRPACTKLVHEPGSTVWWPPTAATRGSEIPGVLVFAPAAPLNFTNASYVRARLLAAIAAEATPPKLVVIEASGVTDIDYTGSQSAQRSIAELRERGIDVAFARLISEHAQERARQSGLIDALHEDHVFQTVQAAVDALAPKPAARA